ncbi:MarR family transcriptional regulator [Rudanella paleaurantiibacter]|uniref:MarR family transcriptional regulator n=1 Tax=Rudanella paleaurantiibacter TaxID=2614655 RepID=A0A7J5U2H6_9BACT|nr:MarR family transcriptional regulator [Rudanella paleaurantiibacter]KAB7731174.1 MarR family transcriptional regulator [Rudanella paleaurantiibacter]
MATEHLKLENQLCFPVYAVSRLITRAYQPFLDELGITYPQYLALLVLWEKDNVTVNDIRQKLVLNTNTVTPLLKRLETMGLIRRSKSTQDERKVLVELTPEGRALESRAATIPERLVGSLSTTDLSVDEWMDLKAKLDRVLTSLGSQQNPTDLGLD